MILSALQKFILKESFGEKKYLLVKGYLKFYQNQRKVSARSEQVKIISKSIDRLINKGLLVGFEEKTKEKWFIKEVKLTAVGQRLAKKLTGEQTKMNFKK